MNGNSLIPSDKEFDKSWGKSLCWFRGRCEDCPDAAHCPEFNYEDEDIESDR
jgi:hypothetical protein